MDKLEVKQISNEISIPNVKESLKLITNALNKSCKEGVFMLDDAFLVKLSLNTMEKFIASIENKDKI